MQCREIEQVLEQEGFFPLPEAAKAHVAGCVACSSLVSDFARIVAAAEELPAEVEPPARVWISLRAQLEAEGIIHEPKIAVAAEKVSWWHGFGQSIKGRMLATAAVAVLIVAAGYLQMNRTSSTGTTSTGASATETSSQAQVNAPVAEPFADTASTLDQEERSLSALQPASVSSVSAVDNSLRENLATLNAFIKECRKRVHDDPQDQVARDYLSAAYQQKAAILAAMMERGRSVN